MTEKIILVFVAHDLNDQHNFFGRFVVSVLSLSLFLDEKFEIRLQLPFNKKNDARVAVILSKLKNYSNLELKVEFDVVDDVTTPKLQKISFLLSILKEQKFVFYVDVDTIFLGNPFRTIIESVDGFSADFAAVQELNTSGDGLIHPINSGFMYLRNSRLVLSTLELWKSDYQRKLADKNFPLLVADQPVLRNAIDKNKLSVFFLPKEMNFRGHEAQYFIDWSWSKIYLVHNHLIFRKFLFRDFFNSLDPALFVKIIFFIHKLNINLNSNIKPNSPRIINFWTLMSSSEIFKIFTSKIWNRIVRK